MSYEPKISPRIGSNIQAGGDPEPFWAFIPRPLPPVDPPLEITGELQHLLERANQTIGRLDGLTTFLPDVDNLIYSYVRREAVLSSQIEGTQSSLSDLLLYEHDQAPGVPVDDAEEASNYVRALNHGLELMRGGLPISLRLIREVHEQLMLGARGANRAPGRFRTVQNWIGGEKPSTALFVPPPPNEVVAAMGELEKFLHLEPEELPLLVKIALAHVQFETIHPFLDGNGRTGRLLISLMLCDPDGGPLSRPLLYLSLFLKRNQGTYYSFLQRIRTEGIWEEWVAFFLRGTIAVAEEAAETARKISLLLEHDRQKISDQKGNVKTALLIHDLAAREVIIPASSLAERLSLTQPTANSTLKRLQTLGILREITGRKRNRIFAYGEYLDLLSDD